MPPTPPTAYKPGTLLTVGSHEVVIDNYVSEGGFAHVYTCQTSPALPDNAVACLKRVAVPNKAYLNLLRAEVEAMKRLRGYSNVVQYYDSHAERMKAPPPGAPPGTPPGYEVFVLMEYCAGGGLIDFMNTRLRDQLKEPEVLKIMFDITLGLAHMHYLSPPLIHRDLKIENVLLTGDGTYKLCDFGSSSPVLRPPKNPQEYAILEDDIQHHTTMQYRAPEMLDLYRGFPIDEKSDIWALGVFLYKLCFYTTPFEQGGNAAILAGTFAIPTKPHYSDRLKNMIRVLLQPLPTQRPTVYQVLKELADMRGVDCPLVDIYAAGSAKIEEVPQAPSAPTRGIRAPAAVSPRPVTPQSAQTSVPPRERSLPPLQSQHRPVSNPNIGDDGAESIRRTKSHPEVDTMLPVRTPSPQLLSRSVPGSTRAVDSAQRAPTYSASTQTGLVDKPLPPKPSGAERLAERPTVPAASERPAGERPAKPQRPAPKPTHPQYFENRYPPVLQPSPSVLPTSPGGLSDDGFDFLDEDVNSRFPTMEELDAPRATSPGAEDLLISFDQSPPSRRPSDGPSTAPAATPAPAPAPVPLVFVSDQDGQSQKIDSNVAARAKALRERTQAQIEAARQARGQFGPRSAATGAAAGNGSSASSGGAFAGKDNDSGNGASGPTARAPPARGTARPQSFALRDDDDPFAVDEGLHPRVESGRESGREGGNAHARKLQQILTGLSERESTVVLETDKDHIDSNMDFLRSLGSEGGPHRPASSLGHRTVKKERTTGAKGQHHHHLGLGLPHGLGHHYRRSSWFGGGGSGSGRGRDARAEDDSEDDDAVLVQRQPRLQQVPQSPATINSGEGASQGGDSLSSSPSTESFQPSNSIQQRVHAFLSEQDRRPSRRTARGYGKYTDMFGDGEEADETSSAGPSSGDAGSGSAGRGSGGAGAGGGAGSGVPRSRGSAPALDRLFKATPPARSHTEDASGVHKTRTGARPAVPSKTSRPALNRRASVGSVSTTSSGGGSVRRLPPKPAHLSSRPKVQQQAN